MADLLHATDVPNFRKVRQVLACLSGVGLGKASKGTVRLWEARALALHHLAAGDLTETVKVMHAAQLGARRSRTPAMNQPRTAAKETL